MKARLVLVASVIAVALAATAYAGGPSQSPAPASTAAVCPASSPSLTATAQLSTTLPVPIEASFPCFAYGACLPCPDGTAQPCLIVQCGTQKTTSCGSCTPDCVPPPG